ncbi:MAG TPA: hypothetical protein VF397_06560 [Pyrinomonadaceae bacterium]
MISTILWLSLPVSGSTAINDHPTAFVALSGVATINGQPVMQAQTLWSNSTAATSRGSELLAYFKNGAHVRLEPETKVEISFTESTISAFINEGRVDSVAPSGIAVQFTTSDSTISNDSADRAEFTIIADECHTTLFVTGGRLTVSNSGKTASLVAGDTFTTESKPQFSQQFLSKKKKIGLFVGIAAAIAIVLLAATGGNDSTPTDNFGGCVIVPSPGAPTSCP